MPLHVWNVFYNCFYYLFLFYSWPQFIACSLQQQLQGKTGKRSMLCWIGALGLLK